MSVISYSKSKSPEWSCVTVFFSIFVKGHWEREGIFNFFFRRPARNVVSGTFLSSLENLWTLFLGEILRKMFVCIASISYRMSAIVTMRICIWIYNKKIFFVPRNYLKWIYLLYPFVFICKKRLHMKRMLRNSVWNTFIDKKKMFFHTACWQRNIFRMFSEVDNECCFFQLYAAHLLIRPGLCPLCNYMIHSPRFYGILLAARGHPFLHRLGRETACSKD